MLWSNHSITAFLNNFLIVTQRGRSHLNGKNWRGIYEKENFVLVDCNYCDFSNSFYVLCPICACIIL